MTSPITIVVNGEAVAKGRPRMTKRGFAYTPAATRKYEAHARLAAGLAMADRARLELLVELPVPASWSKRKHAAAIKGDVLPTSRPDLDNFVKSALDAINTIVVRDDAQITELRARKRLGEQTKLAATIRCSNENL
jgi:Holliday junction resolvase RusA-like endonuclease